MCSGLALQREVSGAGRATLEGQGAGEVGQAAGEHSEWSGGRAGSQWTAPGVAQVDTQSAGDHWWN